MAWHTQLRAQSFLAFHWEITLFSRIGLRKIYRKDSVSNQPESGRVLYRAQVYTAALHAAYCSQDDQAGYQQLFCPFQADRPTDDGYRGQAVPLNPEKCQTIKTQTSLDFNNAKSCLYPQQFFFNYLSPDKELAICELEFYNLDP